MLLFAPHVSLLSSGSSLISQSQHGNLKTKKVDREKEQKSKDTNSARNPPVCPVSRKLREANKKIKQK
jgi:hypothetical protein